MWFFFPVLVLHLQTQRRGRSSCTVSWPLEHPGWSQCSPVRPSAAYVCAPSKPRCFQCQRCMRLCAGHCPSLSPETQNSRNDRVTSLSEIRDIYLLVICIKLWWTDSQEKNLPYSIYCLLQWRILLPLILKQHCHGHLVWDELASHPVSSLKSFPGALILVISTKIYCSYDWHLL